MWKRWLVLGLILVVLLLGIVSVYLFYQPIETELVASPTSENISTDKVEWAKTMLAKFPYNKRVYAGVLAGKRPEEVWIVGKGELDASDPKRFLKIYLERDTIRIGITPKTEFATQVDADLFGLSVEIASSSAIQLGDLLIIKATVERENVMALTIRKLNIVNSP